MILWDFLSNVDELNYGACNEVWMNMFEFLDRNDDATRSTSFVNYNVYTKLKINCKLIFHIVYAMIEFFMETKVRDDIGDNYNDKFDLREVMQKN